MTKPTENTTGAFQKIVVGNDTLFTLLRSIASLMASEGGAFIGLDDIDVVLSWPPAERPTRP